MPCSTCDTCALLPKVHLTACRFVRFESGEHAAVEGGAARIIVESSNYRLRFAACAQVNPHVAGILQAQAQRSEQPRHMPRQGGPGVQLACSGSLMLVAGVSAFAFQGTNAHAVVSHMENGPSTGAVNAATPLHWQRRRLWCAGRPV